MNSSEEDHGEEKAVKEEWYIYMLKIFVTIFGILGCAFVLFTIMKRKSLQNQNGIFIFSVCLSDFVQAVILMPINLASEFNLAWPLSQTACDIVGSLTVSLMTVSVYSILGMNIDKTLAIVFPFKYQTYFSVKVVIMVCFSIWIISLTAIFGGIMVVGGEYVPDNGHCMPDFLKIPQLFVLFAVILLFAIITIGLMNVVNLVVAWRQSKKISDLVKEDVSVIATIRKGLITTSLLVMGMYLTWSPTIILLLLEFSLNKHAPKWLENSHIWLQFSNSTLNISIYIIRMKHFRRELQRLFGCGKSSGDHDSTNT
ncbi:unnamed protein product [Dimorphilus gyrociliatus]|uniref:G-protein coupled receptors family 1 profile domain-containing protein n=1 Tax=Dimorphilus gyrociliatus TaxID=2664684 RepID=A0A7I8W1D7_9ANNE|nr:unnamed protein product [Dimorphilus gyrociliatus]